MTQTGRSHRCTPAVVKAKKSDAMSWVRYQDKILKVGGAIAISLECCCEVCCCAELYRKSPIRARVIWACPVGSPSTVTYDLNLYWDESLNYWIGSVVGFCSNPSDFDIELACGDAISIPMPEEADCGPSPKLFMRVNGHVWCAVDCTFPVVDVVFDSDCLGDGNLAEFDCCTMSPGGLQSVVINYP